SLARGGRAADGRAGERRRAAARGRPGDRERRQPRRARCARGGGMANTRPMRVAVALAAVLAAVPAWAANPCEEGREQTGLAVPVEARASLDDLVRELRALMPGDRPPGQLADYSHRLLRLHRQLEALAARHTAPPAAVDGLRTVLRYFDAAEVAWAADESVREHERPPRHLASSQRPAAAV